MTEKCLSAFCTFFIRWLYILDWTHIMEFTCILWKNFGSLALSKLGREIFNSKIERLKWKRIFYQCYVVKFSSIFFEIFDTPILLISKILSSCLSLKSVWVDVGRLGSKLTAFFDLRMSWFKNDGNWTIISIFYG